MNPSCDIPEQSHQWFKNPMLLELICERCDYRVAVKTIARFGWDINDEEDIYWALGGNDMFSDGCCPRRVN
ncbi:hypothetical protein LCGC14_2618650 [marine sediment metagenome]|uniref:Uncharacterized protein n=1 Tax=marine sediment metagenome TaxID=412755 RepID=A0A0F9CWC7_9ZZZZ